MTAPAPEPRSPRARDLAPIFALGIAMIAGAWLAYQLLDVVLLVFLGITLAAALQPWHTKLCQLGVPRGFAVLLIYLLFAGLLAGIAVLVVPPLIEEVALLLSAAPEKYAALLTALHNSPTRMLRILGQRLPPFEALPTTVSLGTAESVRGLFGLTSGVFAVLTWVVGVLAVAFYWTLDVPRLERLVLSLLPVHHRPQALGAWREIESKLGGYLRAQGMAMLAIGVAAGIGYVLLGLPNPLALAVLAGLFEGVPLLGPFLAAVPALLAAIPLGLSVVLLTLGWSTVVQMLESNVLVPRLMSHAVGVSSLVSLVAILAFGTTYGVLGVFVAVPLAAVVQVVLDRFLLEPTAQPDLSGSPGLSKLRTRARALKQRMRVRLRERPGRMGIDPNTPEHVADAADLQLAEAVERISTIMRTVQRASGTTDTAERSRIMTALQTALQGLENAVARVDAIEPASDADVAAETPPLDDELARATAQAEQAVKRAEALVGPVSDVTPPPVRRLDRA